MTAGQPVDTIFGPGKFVVGPTNFASAYPYGGEEIGRAREVVFNPNVVRTRIVAEEDGGHVVASSYKQAGPPRLAAFLRGFNTDAVEKIPGGSTTGIRVLRGMTKAPGILLTQQRVVFVPDDRTNGLALLLHAATLDWDRTATLQLSYARELVLPVVWEAEIIDTYGVYQCDRISNLIIP